jgi:chemotaxis protein methyltransferase CheR
MTQKPSASSFSDLPAPVRESMQPQVRRTLHAEAESLHRNGQYREAARKLLFLAEPRGDDPASLSMLTRSLANLGELAEALDWCNRWTASDRLDPASYYLRAVILLEQGEVEAARTALQQSVYLEPGFVLAHFALGNLARDKRQAEVSRRHFENALRLLGSHEPDEILPESGGLTAARLVEVITSTMAIGAAR